MGIIHSEGPSHCRRLESTSACTDRTEQQFIISIPHGPPWTAMDARGEPAAHDMPGD